MLTAPALGLALLEPPPVRALALHADGVSSLPELARLLERGQALGKPVAADRRQLDVGQRAAALHSGAAATPRRRATRDGPTSTARSWSAVSTSSPGRSRLWRRSSSSAATGPRVAIFSDSGGSGIVLADVVEALGVPVLEPGPRRAGEAGRALRRHAQPLRLRERRHGAPDRAVRRRPDGRLDPRYGIFAFATPLGLAVAEHSVHVEQLDEFSTTVSALGRVPVIAGLVPLPGRPTARRAAMLSSPWARWSRRSRSALFRVGQVPPEGLSEKAPNRPRIGCRLRTPATGKRRSRFDR